MTAHFPVSAFGRSGLFLIPLWACADVVWAWRVLRVSWAAFLSCWLESWWWFWSEPGEFSQVLCGGGEQELVLRAARITEAEPTELEDALEMGEQHLDPLTLVPGLLEGWGAGQRSDEVAGILIDVPRDLGLRRVGTATRFKRTRMAVELAGPVQ
jgi:hypothetical protein